MLENDPMVVDLDQSNLLQQGEQEDWEAFQPEEEEDAQALRAQSFHLDGETQDSSSKRSRESSHELDAVSGE